MPIVAKWRLSAFSIGTNELGNPKLKRAFSLDHQNYPFKLSMQSRAIATFTAVFIYLDHKLIFVFLSSFAPLRLCVRYKDVVHLPENRCKQFAIIFCVDG
ncbi:MAG: hypothetical protein ACFKPT_27580 [Gloeotrichia echinulata GP01]